MRTSQLDQIMRQKAPELRRAVELLANNETEKGDALLAEQGRVTEIADANERIAAIARDYAAQPENSLIISPDNRSRRLFNKAVRAELRNNGTLAVDGHELRVLNHRSDMTGADRTWATRCNAGDVLHSHTSSKAEGIERNSYARVREVDARGNTLTVELKNGTSVTYDPRRLRGVNVFTESMRGPTVYLARRPANHVARKEGVNARRFRPTSVLPCRSCASSMNSAMGLLRLQIRSRRTRSRVSGCVEI
ncbi:hypothetical protein ACOBR2_17925 [Telmatobacter bradus]|uniref:hypothetical protein n=1 Tax=Telmatobacter bradus TaxID=474953 RepID=UPI003B43CDE0